MNLTENKKKTVVKKLKTDVKKNYVLYLLFLPVLSYFIIFCYLPMAGIAMAFYDYVPRLGFSGSDFIGFKHFAEFFSGNDFWTLMRNTFMLNVWDVIFAFPSPIILAIMFFELRSKKFRNISQTITYMPYFISLVVVSGMIVQFSKSDGLFNVFSSVFNVAPKNYLHSTNAYVPIFVGSNIWQNVGFASIVYYAALCSVDTQLFDAAKIDGAGKMRQLLSVSLPSIMPTIIIMFILRMGSLLNVGFEKAYLLQTPLNTSVSEVISTHVYKLGLSGQRYSYGTAVGLFNAVINLVFLLIANYLSKRSDNSLF